uniref:cytoplasmic dynein 2 heavy chain 1-like n=1 Tax=Ciona intestinalis TaxID=7719 RepID=UPI000EF447D7|nr:cytoplasmic dynein 2 heavy chain 1-like [Ciona intestinalis]|eukprot:XP_026693271.1 cytoplasmic dynein 2 heavy chain 1-like [Ciona intestinalis]
MAKDERKDFITKLISTNFNNHGNLKFASETELDSFLDDGNCSTLVSYLDSEKQIRLANSISGDTAKKNVLVFFKPKPETITLQNLHTNILISSMPDAVNGLYHSVQKVFAPSLLKDNTKGSLNPNLQKLLVDLEQSLGTTIRKSQSSSHVDKNQPEENTSGILTPLDECKYWHEISLSGSRLDVQERAQHFLEYLKPLESQFQSIDSLSLVDCMELVEQLQDSLDDIWKQTEFPAYPEARMLNFLTVIGDELCRFAQRKLDSEFSSIWVGPYIAVREGLRNAVGICDRWITMCATLTSRIWKQYPSHVWNSGKYKATNVINSMTRFQEVCDLRTVHEHLLRLLSTTDRERLCPDDILAKTFSKVAALHYNSYTEPVWRSAVATYERAMQPAEDAVAGKLRRRLHDSSGKVGSGCGSRLDAATIAHKFM